MILFHSADLLWATKIKSTAEAMGIAARPVRNMDMLEARLGDSPVRGLIVDLDQPETALAFIERVRRGSGGDICAQAKDRKELGDDPIGQKETSRIRILAFGPHVAEDALRAAKSAGADMVMTRGAFHARLALVLEQLSNGAN